MKKNERCKNGKRRNVEAEEQKNKNREEIGMDRQREDGGGMRSCNDVFGCWLFCSDCGSYHGNLINRCPTYQQGIRLHSSVNKHTHKQQWETGEEKEG